jgi:hypothetical protein
VNVSYAVRQLGQASRCSRASFTHIRRGDSRVQIGAFSRAPDYVTASTLLDPTFACSAGGDPTVENISHVCDPQRSKGESSRVVRRSGRGGSHAFGD